MASSMKTLTRKQLSKKLVEKHKKFLSNYEAEFALLHKLFVLKEKQDLLDHWIEDAEIEDDNKKLDKYSKQKKKNDSETGKLKKELSELSDDENPASRSRYNLLKQRIDSHKQAIEHWSCELSK